MSRDDIDIERIDKLLNQVQELSELAEKRSSTTNQMVAGDKDCLLDNKETVEKDLEQIHATLSNAKTTVKTLQQQINQEKQVKQ